MNVKKIAHGLLIFSMLLSAKTAHGANPKLKYYARRVEWGEVVNKPLEITRTPEDKSCVDIFERFSPHAGNLLSKVPAEQLQHGAKIGALGILIIEEIAEKPLDENEPAE